MSFILGLVAIGCAVAAWHFVYNVERFKTLLGKDDEPLTYASWCSGVVAICGLMLFEPKMAAASLMFSAFTLGIWFAQRKR